MTTVGNEGDVYRSNDRCKEVNISLGPERFNNDYCM